MLSAPFGMFVPVCLFIHCHPHSPLACNFQRHRLLAYLWSCQTCHAEQRQLYNVVKETVAWSRNLATIKGATPGKDISLAWFHSRCRHVRKCYEASKLEEEVGRKVRTRGRSRSWEVCWSRRGRRAAFETPGWWLAWSASTSGEGGRFCVSGWTRTFQQCRDWSCCRYSLGKSTQHFAAAPLAHARALPLMRARSLLCFSTCVWISIYLPPLFFLQKKSLKSRRLTNRRCCSARMDTGRQLWSSFCYKS